jgi:hypothetical protein
MVNQYRWSLLNLRVALLPAVRLLTLDSPWPVPLEVTEEGGHGVNSDLHQAR